MSSSQRWGLLVAAAATVVLWLLRGSTPAGDWRAIQEAVAQKRWVEAESLLLFRVTHEPNDGRAWLELGSVRGTLGRRTDAKAALERVAASAPEWSKAQYLLGNMALEGHECAEAERIFRGLAEHDPKSTPARIRLVHLLFVQRRTDEARGVLWELYRLTRDPRHLLTLTGLGQEDRSRQLRDLTGDSDRLKKDLDLFLEQTPDDPWLRRARGLLELELGHPAEARVALEGLADQMEDDPAGQLALAECQIAAGDLRAGGSLLGTLPRRADDRARWWLLAGQIEEASGRVEESVTCWLEAVEADSRDRSAHYRLGQALIREGKGDEARPFLERAEAIRVSTSALSQAVHDQLGGIKDAVSCENLGRLCLESGMKAEGRAWYEQAIRRDPTRQAAQVALARLSEVALPPVFAPRLRRRGATVPIQRESTVAATAAGPRFEDQAAARGLVFQYDPGALGNLFIGDTMGGGVGLLDYDDDGWLDVYFVNGCRLPIDPANPPAPNRLFRNKGDGTFEDVTARAGVGGRGYGMGCAVGDFDNDGRDDLFVTGLGATVLYRNVGDGRFEDVTERAGVSSNRWCTAAGFGDLDGDGDLDLVVVTYVDADPTHFPDCRDVLGHSIHCPPGRFPAVLDHLFRNNGDGTFTDVSREAGLDVPDGRGLGLAIADFDQDGRLDLFVANDAVPDFLFRNLGGLRFEEVGVNSGAAYDGLGRATASMGVAADDLDGDGLIDIFHTNFHNEGNTLLRNLGGGLFADASARAGLDGPSRPVTGFGTTALDADNDGLLDLFVANGHVDDQPWQGQPMAQPPHWYTGLGDGRFAQAKSTDVSTYFGRPRVGRGVAAGDIDNDGRVDLVVVHRDGPASLLLNTSREGHWLGFRLRGQASGRTPVGARVTCRVGGRDFVRWLTSGTGYLSAHDSRLWFGLGAAAKVDDVEVRWPSGAIQRWSGFEIDRIVDLREGYDPVTAPAAIPLEQMRHRE